MWLEEVYEIGVLVNQKQMNNCCKACSKQLNSKITNICKDCLYSFFKKCVEDNYKHKEKYKGLYDRIDSLAEELINIREEIGGMH